MAPTGVELEQPIRANSHIEVTGVQREVDEVRVGVSVSGDGYNGGGAMTFTLDGDRIARMVITG
jgi:hypothetical protein